MGERLSSRQRLKMVLERKVPDRVPMVDISFWPETLERWRREGMPEGTDPASYFGLDRIEIFRFDGSLRLPEEVVEETERWRIRRDPNGVLIKEWKDWRISYSPPSRVDCYVKGWDEWLKVKGRLEVGPDRVGEEALRAYERWREEDRFVVISPVEPMWFLIEHLTGFEVGLPMLVEQPDLAKDILETYTDFVLGMCQMLVERGLRFDGLWFFADLCYKNGMLFSPEVYRELLLPCHRRVKEWCESQGMPLMLHCDGDVREFVPLLIEAGFDPRDEVEILVDRDAGTYAATSRALGKFCTGRIDVSKEAPGPGRGQYMAGGRQ